MSDYKPRPRNEFEATMEKKSEYIKDAQKRKNDNIQIAGLQRDATLLACARIAAHKAQFPDVDWTRKQVEAEWEYWHNFLNNKLSEQVLGF
jgi:hypothetical protein